jgi:hypothetical protein
MPQPPAVVARRPPFPRLQRVDVAPIAFDFRAFQ